METLNISGEHIQDDAANANRLEIIRGACTVLLCNTDIGRSVIRSMLDEDGGGQCRIFYQGETVALTGGPSALKTGLSALDEGLYGRLKTRDYLTFWNELYEAQMPVSEILGLFGLAARANERINKLSYSEKRLLGFARSVLHDPDLIIWEEPEQNLDLESCMIVRRVIEEFVQKEKALLITSSSLEQALSVSSRIFRFNGSVFSPLAAQETSDFGASGSPGSVGITEISGAAGITETSGALEAPGISVTSGAPESLTVSEPGEIPPSPEHAALSRLMIKSEDKYVFIDPSHIHFIESNEGITQLYAKEGEFPCSWTLAELEVKLKPHRLYRCHRSYIVNLDCIAELIVWSRNSYSLVLNDDKRSRIPLSKGKFEELKAIISL